MRLTFRHLTLSVLLICTTALAACGKSRQQIETEFNAKREAATKMRLLGFFERRLKDPDSVKYRDLVVKLEAMADQDGRRAVGICGEFNARNGMGGYGGFGPFVIYQYGDEEPTIWTSEGGEPFASMTRKIAQSMGCLA